MDKVIHRKDLNLLDRLSNKTLKRNVRGTFIIIVAIILAFIILLGIIIPQLVLSGKTGRLAVLNQQLETNRVYAQEYDEIMSNINVYESMMRDLSSIESGGLTVVLGALEKVVPSSGVTIQSISITTDNYISLNGYANDEKTIADFITSVNESDEINLVSVSGAVSNGDVQSFSMMLSYQSVQED